MDRFKENVWAALGGTPGPEVADETVLEVIDGLRAEAALAETTRDNALAEVERLQGLGVYTDQAHIIDGLRAGAVAAEPLDEVLAELRRLEPTASSMEAWAFLRATGDELWCFIKAGRPAAARGEAVRLAAQALQFVITGDARRREGP